MVRQHEAAEQTAFEDRTCRGKKRYRTYHAAERASKEMRKITKVRTPFATYYCDVCHDYHFGRRTDTQMGKRRTRQREREEASLYDTSGLSETSHSEDDVALVTTGKRWKRR